MTRVGRVFQPIAANQAMYDRLYRQVYRKMYARLQPMYRQIAEITGYPKAS
jgi:sugar (pentulose or hexulose) kinase